MNNIQHTMDTGRYGQHTMNKPMPNALSIVHCPSFIVHCPLSITPSIVHRSCRRAFTLMEVVVVMGIFVTIVLMVSGIYLMTASYGRQIVIRAKLQADTRNALEAISRAVRVSNFDYASYSGGVLPSQPTNELRLINPATGDTSRIKMENNDGGCYGDGKSFPCIIVSTDGGSNWAPLTPRGVKVDGLRFYASPDRDPFLFNQATGVYIESEHPVVTIFLKIDGLALYASDEWSFALQTTVSPRIYLR